MSGLTNTRLQNSYPRPSHEGM